MAQSLSDAAAPTPLRSKPMWFVFALIAIAVIYLRWQGRVWWCQQGDYWPISLKVNSPHNSQHLFDAYSLSHVLHGILFYGLLWLFRRRVSLGWRGAIAATVEIGWGVVGESPGIINPHRTPPMSPGYTRHSINNSLGGLRRLLGGRLLGRQPRAWVAGA